MCRHNIMCLYQVVIETLTKRKSLWLQGESLPAYFVCHANQEGWVVESERTNEEGYLCIDTRRQVLTNASSKKDLVSCR